MTQPRIWRAYHPHPREGTGALVVLDETEPHHVIRALRLRAGEPLSLFDGAGQEWRGRIVRCDGDAVHVELIEQDTEPVEPELALHLFQGACRPERMDWVVQKATEVGIRSVTVMRFERAEGALVTDRRLQRWRRIAVEAAKQCERRMVPGIDAQDQLPAADPGEPPSLLLDTGHQARSLGDVVTAFTPSIRLAVGPESGFSPGEADALRESGWQSAGLGPRTLRTESAGLVAAAILLHRWADLGPASP
jgi:16S rRNA (uracil1498-N3)-methyltransferase